MRHRERALVMIMQNDQVLLCCFCIHNEQKTIGTVVPMECAKLHKAKMHKAQVPPLLEDSKPKDIFEESVIINYVNERLDLGEYCDETNRNKWCNLP